MSIDLTNEEKLNIVNQHLKVVDYAIYGYQLDLLEAEAVATPDASFVASLNERISNATLKRTALVEEKNSLT
jgi:hypothetical protein